MTPDDDFDALLHGDPDAPAAAPAAAGRRAGTGWAVGSAAIVLLGAGVLAGTLILSTATPSIPEPAAAAPSTEVGAPTPVSAASPRPQEKTATGVTTGVDADWVADVSEQTGIPPRALAAYAGASLQAASEYPGCGLGWNTLAGIGHVESHHGEINGSQLDATGTAAPAIIGIALTGQTTESIPDSDAGRLDGDTVWDRAVGPMQFIPTTWDEWGADGNGDGAKDPQNIDDSTLAAARYLCHIGGDLTQPDRWIAAIAAYNNTIEYNNRVADAAAYYATAG